MAGDGSIKIGIELLEGGFKKGLSALGGVAKTGLKATTAAIAGVTAAAGAAAAGLSAVEAATEEYRIAQGKLNTAFQAAGLSAAAAQQSYQGFYEILGETDTAAEASQLLASLTESEQDVATWTNIAAGVFGTFGDALPIEGLIESANETAKVGQVTGSLADALNWAGISEDEFNQKLENCTTESQRNQLIMRTLANTYDGAAQAFYKNNEALISARQNQIRLDEALSALGETVSRVKTELTGDFLPGIAQTAEAFNDLLNGVEGADRKMEEAITSLVSAAVEQLPEFLQFGLDVATAVVTSLANGIVQNLPAIAGTLYTLLQTLAAVLAENLPVILDAGIQLLSSLAQGLMLALPALLEAVPEILAALAGSLLAEAPVFLAVGGDFLGYLAEGISSGAAKVTSALPEVVQSILDYFGEHLPEMLEAGAAIVKDLARGLLYGIRNLAQALPEVLQSILDFFDEHGAELLAAGAELLGFLARGVLDTIPLLFDALAELVLTFLGAGDEINAGFGEKTKTLSGILQGLVVAFVAAKAAVLGYQTAMAVSEVIERARAALSALTNITNLQTAAQAALNFVMGQNPFVLVTTAVFALVGAFATLMATSETFRNAVVSAFNAVIQKAKELWEWLGKVSGGLIGGTAGGASGIGSGIARPRAAARAAASETAENGEEGVSLTAASPSRAMAVQALASAMPGIEARIGAASASLAPAAGYSAPALAGGGGNREPAPQSTTILRPNWTIQFQGDTAQLGRALDPVIKAEGIRLGAGV